MTHDHFREVFIKLGEERQLSDEVVNVLEEFKCCFYVIHSEICDFNEMRYELFRVKEGCVESAQLPPPPPARIISIYMLRLPTIRLASGIARCMQIQKYQAHWSAKAGHWVTRENFR